MKEAFIVLLTAHLIGDFLCQSKGMVKVKYGSFKYLALHSLIVSLATLFFAANFAISCSMLVYLWVFVAHLIIDWVKQLIGKDDIYTFLADQTLHIIALFIIACQIPDIAEASLWLKLFPASYFKGLTVISGLVASVYAGGIVVSKATKPLLSQVSDMDNVGLKHGGRYIGQLERALTFFFMLTGQTNAIGFLFAAKSILRFGEIKEKEKRKEAEYIIIGTFMSFGWALLVAYLTSKAITLW